MKKRLIFCLLFMFFANLIIAQDTIFWNKRMIQVAAPTSTPDWIKLKPEVDIKATAFFKDLKSSMGLSDKDEMKNYKTEIDNTGITHFRYQQYFKGYRIEGAEYLLHEKGGRTISANGKLIKRISNDPVIKLSRDKALDFAKKYYPSKKYAWEISQYEKDLKEVLHDPKATYFPKGEIVWVSKNKNNTARNGNDYVLAYSFDIYTSDLVGERVFVSASDGTILKTLPLTANCNAASVATNFYGVQNFSVKQVTSAPSSYNLWNDCQAAFIHTRLWTRDSLGADSSIFTFGTEYTADIRNNWSTMASAATSHWCTERAYNYFLEKHERKGWNNADAGVNIYQNALFCYKKGCTPTDPSNANMGFSNGSMKVGNNGTADPIDDYNTLDIIAHEFTHAVTGTTANLAYQGESGALNESFSDIFGASCMEWQFGFNANMWKHGFDRKNPSNPAISYYSRNLADPNDKFQPDTYLAKRNFWIPSDTSWDYGGVHTNSGVQNYMFYLLVSGGKGINHNGLSYSVLGVGISAARDIAYQALRYYLVSSSTYPDARNAWVHAAVDLYGQCSYQAVMTGKAWDAVGLPPPINYSVITYCQNLGTSNFFEVNSGIISLSPNCFMTVAGNGIVEFGARQVVLNPGFTAKEGSHFRAYASECTYSYY